MRAGNAWLSGKPNPAVRLVPRNTIASRSSAAAVAWGSAPEDRTRSVSRASFGAHATPRTRSKLPSILRAMMIEAKGLGKTYLSGGKPLTVLKNSNLTIEARSFVAIVGPSGSGKTTLLGLLAGLDDASSGVVSLNGVNISRLTEDERAKFRAEHVGFVFQSFQLITTLTARENVMVPFELLGRANGAGTDAETRAVELLERVGLGSRLDHYPAQLSGGEQQRVALARAFANQPKILFADEPTGNLDANTGHKIIDLMVELNHDAQTTLVLVTHDPELANRAHRVIRLSDGEIVAS